MSRKARETRTEIEAAVAAGERGLEQALADLTGARIEYTAMARTSDQRNTDVPLATAVVLKMPSKGAASRRPRP